MADIISKQVKMSVVKHMSYVLYVIIVFLTVTSGRPRRQRQRQQQNNIPELYTPEGRSRDDWLTCSGMPCHEWNRVQRLITELNLIDLNKGENPVKTVGPLSNLFGDMSAIAPASHDELARPWEGTDILLSVDQAEQIYINAMEKVNGARRKGRRRQKRKINRDKTKRWDFPIPFKFDGSHNSQEKSKINQALKNWENDTCVRFHEVDYRYQLEQAHLMFTRGSYGCASYVGKINFGKYNPQPISLDSMCFAKYGIPVHEIGHALGLWHEHQRPIRDNHVYIDNRNIFFWAYSNFMAGTLDHVQSYGIPYDFNSVMHYGPTVGSRNGMATIRPRNDLYKLNIGQREELSFLDAKVVNMGYCQDICKGQKTRQKCRNGGYQNPNDCSRCKCPDGLYGDDCTGVQPSNGNCGGRTYLNTRNSYEIETPGHSKGNYYDIGTECYWLIETKPRNRIVLSFEGEFNVMCEYESCSHWVEVKTKEDIGAPGPRFCCERLPDTRLVSDTGKMVIVFKSLAKPTTDSDNFIGFKATIRLDTNGIPDQPTSSSSSTTIKITTPTTTPKPATTTPKTTTTTTPKPTTTTPKPTTTTPKPTTTTPKPTTTTTPKPTTTTKLTTTTTTTPLPPAINTSARRRFRFTTTNRRGTSGRTRPPNQRFPTATSTSTMSTTTTTTTTTTPAPTTTITSTNTREGWTEWSSCLGMDCKCGGCSWQIRYKLCGRLPCRGTDLRSERKPCDRVCTVDDTERFWVARFYTRQCKECCSGFVREGDTCILGDMSNDLQLEFN